MFALRWIVGLVVVLGLGAGNVLREACWTQADGFVCGPLSSRPVEGRWPPTPIGALTRIEVPVPAWRPLAITVRLAGADAAAVRLSDRGDAGELVVRGNGSIAVLEAGDAATTRLVLWAEPDGPPVPGTTVAIVAIDPVMRPGRTMAPVLTGALAGIVLVWCVGTTPPSVGKRWPRIAPGSLAAPLAILVLVHGPWTLLRPPLQSPDELQHHARATTVAASPYIAGDVTIPLSATRRNPLTWNTNRLHGLFFRPHERLSAAQVDAVRSTTWTPPAPYPSVQPIPSGIASYPPLYYWLVFAGGQLATWSLDLGPYTSVLAYRVASVCAAAVLWLAVYTLLASIDSLRRWVLPGFVLLAATPGTAAITGSVNADALAIPATVLLVLAAWRGLSEGGSTGLVAVTAALALAVKPSGLLAVAAVSVGIAWRMFRRPGERQRGWALMRVLGGVTVAAFVVFYAWSPPQLTPGPRPPLPLLEYAQTVVLRLPNLWVEYWGWLGWQEYGAPMVFYWVILGVGVALAVAAARPDRPADGFAPLVAIVAVAYAAGLVIGEYANHAKASLVLQGRYLLPLAACTLPLVRQRSPLAAWALPALLLTLNLVLVQATIDRYFGGDWALWWRSLTGA